MKRVFNILVGLGVVIVLIAALFKEMHLHSAKLLTIIGICVVLVAMVFYFIIVLRGNKPPTI